MRLDHSDDALSEVHEINVTPFIDVMLVLLIIFMVAAPLATVDIKVNLPALSAEPQQRPDEPLYLTLKSDLSLALGARGRQIDRDIHSGEGSRDHEDDQQHQDHVDERRDVDLMGFGKIVAVMSEADSHGAIPRRAPSAPMMKCGRSRG